MDQAPPLGAALAASAAAQSGKRWTRGEPFRVGCLNVSSYSHLMGLWAPLINPRKGEKDTPFTGMRITHCWEIDPAKAEEFARIYGCEAVKNFDDMVGKVDGVISGGYYNYGTISCINPISRRVSRTWSTDLSPTRSPKPGR